MSEFHGTDKLFNSEGGTSRLILSIDTNVGSISRGMLERECATILRLQDGHEPLKSAGPGGPSILTGYHTDFELIWHPDDMCRE